MKTKFGTMTRFSFCRKYANLIIVTDSTATILASAISEFLNEKLYLKTLMLIITFSVFSTGYSQITIDHQNCETPKLVCEVLTEMYMLEDTTKCTEPLYFYLNYDYTFGSASFNVESTTNPLLFLVLYGPFNGGLLNACSQIETLNVPFELALTGNSLPPVNFSVEQGYYILKATFDNCTEISDENVIGLKISPIGDHQPLCEPELVHCEDCITSFSPNAGKYLVSAWVKEEGVSPSTTSYSNSSIEISYTGDASTETLVPSGQIIDGWQRVEGVINIPVAATDIHLSFETSSGTSYYDDIRFHPLDGSMMSYVYDPITLRLMAELDERNYATFYEYDEEGKLVRVKKETEKGIMTIQENRDNIIKQ